MRRRIEIAQETNSIVVRRSGKTSDRWCDSCGRYVRMVTAEQAALVSGRSLRDLIRVIDNGDLHYHETPEGLLSICLDSLTGHDVSQEESELIIANHAKGK